MSEPPRANHMPSEVDADEKVDPFIHQPRDQSALENCSHSHWRSLSTLMRVLRGIVYPSPCGLPRASWKRTRTQSRSSRPRSVRSTVPTVPVLVRTVSPILNCVISAPLHHGCD